MHEPGREEEKQNHPRVFYLALLAKKATYKGIEY
jgi:hypothetical protein